jgi:hypothetical protein
MGNLMVIKVTIEGRNKLGQFAKILPELKESILREVAERAVDKLEGNMSRHNFGFGTVESISIEEGGSSFNVIGSDVLHYLNEGTEAHWIPKTAELVEWAKAKMTDIPREEARFYALRQSIAKNGTRAYGIIDRAVEELNSELTEIVEEELTMTTSVVIS